MSERFDATAAVRWSVERKGVLILGPAPGDTRFLPYPQAAIWDMLVRGRPFDRIREQLTAIASMPAESAEMLLRDTVAEWLRDGLLQPRGARG